MASTTTVSSRGEQRLHYGHPWIYRSDVLDATASGGDVVEVRDHRGRSIGLALFSDRSQITLRMLTTRMPTARTPMAGAQASGDATDDAAVDALLRTRLQHAIGFRRSLGIDATAFRVVHGEADLLPSLIVDKYADWLVVQTLSQGMDRLLPRITAMLVELLSPAGILARNDPKVRALEGLDQTIEVLYGDVPDAVEVREGPVEYVVDLRKGQKTGLFLDQRENREAAARYARGRLLDCFSYNGGFALRLARQCSEVDAVDISAEAVGRIAANAARNGVPQVQVREANVFDELRRLEKADARYDTIVLDPPAFAKNKASIPSARAGYKEINLRAMRLLSPGGYLVTCSCSYNIDEAAFAEVVHDASVDSRTPMTLVEKRTQGRDHPVLLGVPETSYLKCFILRRVE